MVLAERCALLSAEVLKSQGKYSDAATLLIKMTSEVGTPGGRGGALGDVCTRALAFKLGNESTFIYIYIYIHIYKYM